ncbi:carboxypeptidase-like regulatory domain-containing protein [uncultured Duncaniella sp.]|uniref:carboxypeptidase-like regulatory domain-containing protein n=1 Tax=uncultured Duncaniella sp. TaxID=2768039 RepID=UPI00272A225D|nr:carboxypeptidase-like regulatory domain-containing protein [uncultured Duncaniella sp.]
MRLKLFLLLLLAAILPSFAQSTGVAGTVVDNNTGAPVAGANVMLDKQGIYVTTGPSGDFSISNAQPGEDLLVIVAYGYNDLTVDIDMTRGKIIDLGDLKMLSSNLNNVFYEDQNDMFFDQALLEDEEGSAQSIAALTGASDDVYYNAASYNFQPMRFRVRGYDSKFTETYVNGINFNDLARGRFNYSTLGGMSRAFRDKTTSLGLGAANFGFGNIGGATDINTRAAHYAPGFNGSVAYTNSNYMLRAMAMYSTGLNKNGWAFTISAIGRYAKEGVIEGTFYNSFGLFASLEKVFNEKHSLNLTVWGAPTQRATNSATYEEAYSLTDNNLYNPNWGWQDGKKRSAKIVETFDPTAVLNWIWKPDKGTTLNTGAAFRAVNYSTSALNWYNAADPRPDYYRYLPSYFRASGNEEAADLYTDLWEHDENFRQINWGNLYQANYYNNIYGRGNNPDNHSSSYILENRHSNQINFMLNSVLNHRLNDNMTLQAGISFNYTRAHYYKTIRDLLGGEYWLDIDQYSERDFPDNPDMLQNNLLDPSRHVGKGDTFGYDYYINALHGNAWIQNVITLPQWDINYGLKIGYTQFQRDGKMMNGRAPKNSYGKGASHRFDTGALKAGATYKIDGRNFITAHAGYETVAPLFEYAYISPRIKDTAIEGLKPERILSGDISYAWNYRRFRGAITGFWTEMYDQTERTSYYDDQYSTFMNYVLKGVHTRYKGIEIGAAFKVTPSVTVSAAATFAQYQYKNRPKGTRSYENGMRPDTTQVVYLKNFYVGGTPQTAVNVGIDWAAPKSWFFNVNASWMGDAYVNLSPIHHEALPNLWEKYPSMDELEAKMEELASQDKLNDAFVLNASIGKLIYLNRKVSMNINLNVDNILNNKKIQTYGYQQGRFDYSNYDSTKYPNKYFYAQGIKVYLNVGIRF